MDKLVLDIETANTFADVGGYHNLENLKISFVGAFSYKENKFLSFHEGDIEKLGPVLQRSGLIVGFAINRFDIPVLKKHFSFDLRAIPRLDLLDEIELAVGFRVKLNTLAKINLGREKTGDGLEAIKLYETGKLAELERYCLNDVRLTKELYELSKNQGFLLVPDRTTGEPLKAALEWKETELLATLF